MNNNYYTNVLAKYNLKWAAKIYHLLEAENILEHQRFFNKSSCYITLYVQKIIELRLLHYYMEPYH
nr:hypothetical protein [Bacillus cereus]